MTADRTVRALEELMVADHEERIAEAQRRADEATDDWYRRWHQEDADTLRAMRFSWQDGPRDESSSA